MRSTNHPKILTPPYRNKPPVLVTLTESRLLHVISVLMEIKPLPDNIHPWVYTPLAVMIEFVRCGHHTHFIHRTGTPIPRVLWRALFANYRDGINHCRANYFHIAGGYNAKHGICQPFTLNKEVERALDAADQRYVFTPCKPFNDTGAVHTAPEGGCLLTTPTRTLADVERLTELYRAASDLTSSKSTYLPMLPEQYKSQHTPLQLKIIELAESRSSEDPCLWLRRLKNQTGRVIDLVNSHEGNWPMRFERKTCGRYFASNFPNPQNVHKIIRETALAGSHGYDIKCAVHSILLAHALSRGLKCKQLAAYVHDPDGFRELLAEAVGVPVKVVKEVLIAMIYGARDNNPYGAIHKILDRDKCKLLKASRAYGDLREEISLVTGDMLANAEKPEPHLLKNNAGLVMNVMGKGNRKAKPSSLVAHLLLGMESMMLQAMLSVCKSALIPIHDCVISSDPENIESMIKAIKEWTGIQVTLSHEILDFNA